MTLHYPANNPYFRDDHPIMLDEVTYKDIFNVINPRDLPHRDYAPLLKYVKYVGTEDNTMKFFVPSATSPVINAWNCYVQFIEWDAEVRDTNVTAPEAARLLLWGGNIRLHCGCPSFKFYGYQFILTQLDASMEAEIRFPRIRNPQLKGICCKHLRRCIKTLPFHLGDMAKAIKQQREHYSP
jgi:hypothetical protein